MKTLSTWTILLLVLAVSASAQKIDFHKAAATDPAELARTMPALARQAIANYKDNDRRSYLGSLFKLQMIAGDYASAKATINALRESLKPTDPVYAHVANLQYEIYSDAKRLEAAGRVSFGDAFNQSFRAAFNKLGDKDAYRVSTSFVYNLDRAENDLKQTLNWLKGKDNMEIGEAVDLARKYQSYQVFKNILPLIQPLVSEDENRRYIVQDDVLIKTKDGAKISAIVARQRGLTVRQPAALIFTVYAREGKDDEAIAGAAHGYVGVLAYTRGKALSPNPIEPYEHEVSDTYAVIDWISKQKWSDGQVGMYGGSYNGYACWAATKHLHPALKTIVPYAAFMPGQGLPMENNVGLLANYGWAFYVTDNKYLDDKTYNDRQRWNALNGKWYTSGRPYRQVDAVDGTPNKLFQRWLRHPSYDRYWQDMVPYKEDFSKINIPVLTFTGYYDDGQISALQYLKEHYQYNPSANHYLIIGPWDHIGTQRSRKDEVLRGYAIDPVAQIDTPEITFQWLDFVMRRGEKPQLLKDKINYEVMDANEWKHAPSLERMSNETLRLYLSDAKSGDKYQLSREKPREPVSLDQAVDFADRKTTNNDYYPFPIVGIKPDLSNGFAFISEPFTEPIEITGQFSGEIKAVINKKDMDIGVVLYEVMPSGELFHLAYFIGRASYASDMSVRRLLTPGTVQTIPFDRSRLVSRRLSKGSRLLVTLNVNKNPFAQINYGTGKDVSDEDIKDAKLPLRINWLNGSYLKIPIWK
jgi:putative CocE/NonD family hydrolase